VLENRNGFVRVRGLSSNQPLACRNLIKPVPVAEAEVVHTLVLVREPSIGDVAVAEGLLDAGSRAYDITQQVIHQGFHSLTPAQRQAYITEAVPALNEMMRRRFIRECSDNDNTAD
jgi:hypothetical protein